MSSFLGASEEGYAAGAMPARVNFGERSSSTIDKVCCGVFSIMLAAYGAVVAYLYMNKTVHIRNGRVEFELSLQEQINQCTSNGRLLENAPITFFEVFDEAWYVPLVVILVALILGLGFVAAIYAFPKTVAWSSVFLNILMYVMAGVAFLTCKDCDAGTVGAIYLGIAAVLLLVAYITREKIKQAARTLKTASLAVSKNKLVVPANCVLEVLLIGSLVTFWYGVTSAGFNLEVNQCKLRLTPIASNSYYFLLFMFFWTTAWLTLAKLHLTAMTIGSWYFAQEDGPSGVAFHALRTTLSKSAPVITSFSIITTIVDYIVDIATRRFWWTDPVGIVLRFLFCIFQSCIMALTKYGVVGHAFLGKGFGESTKSAYKVLKRNFVGGYVTDRVGASVVFVMSRLLATALGLLAWYMIDQAHDVDSLGRVFSYLHVKAGFIGLVAFVFGWIYLHGIPVFSIMAMCMIPAGFMDPATHAAMGGLFVGCICSIVLHFLGSIILDATTTIFMAYAIGKNEGKTLPQDEARAFVYTLMEEDMKTDVIPDAVAVR